jgi:hypothetical protein
MLRLPSRITLGDYSHLPEDDRPWVGKYQELDTQILWRRLMIERTIRAVAKHCKNKNSAFFTNQCDRIDQLAKRDL